MSIIISDYSGINFLKDISDQYSIYFIIGKNDEVQDISDINYSGLYINSSNLTDCAYKRNIAQVLKKIDHIVLAIDSDRKSRDKYKVLGIKSSHPSQLYDGILKNIFVTDLFYLG